MAVYIVSDSPLSLKRDNYILILSFKSMGPNFWTT